MAQEETLSWFAGVDWGSEKHQACVVDAQGRIVGEREFPHGGTRLAELGDWLLAIAGAAGTVAVAIEVPHGPVVDSLVDQWPRRRGRIAGNGCVERRVPCFTV